MSSAVADPPKILKVALIGNPNTGKSTVFNALAGMNVRTGNYPGVTVEKKVGHTTWNEQAVKLIDLPGTYSLSPRSPDEAVAVHVLLGRQDDVGKLDAVICVVDACRLERNLYLVSQLLEMEIPVVMALNMWDSAQRRGVDLDIKKLSNRLGIPVIRTSANKLQGVDELRAAVQTAIASPVPSRPTPLPDTFYDAANLLGSKISTVTGSTLPAYEVERILLDEGGTLEQQLLSGHPTLGNVLVDTRSELRQAGCQIPSIEPAARFQWSRSVFGEVTRDAGTDRSLTERLDSVLLHKLFGPLAFLAVMFLVFQTLYTWAGPLMDLCEQGQGFLSGLLETNMSPGPFRSLLIDGVIAGVGGVLIFLPQIALLFFFISILEDCGYMARAAFLVDRLMAVFGLNGKSFLPLMSSFACAVPGVMATRVIENRRDRLVTILIAPLMSCSARLPVYLLLIGAFVPATAYAGGWVSLRGLVLLAMTALGAVVAIPVALILKALLKKSDPSPFVLELPDYKTPSARVVLSRVWDRSKAFFVRAGTLIFASSILIWAAATFPGDRTKLYELQSQIEATDEADEETLAALSKSYNAENGRLVEQSALGRIGKVIEPVVKPLGWDWKIGVGAIASFPAREVIIATLGTIYSLGGDVDEEDTGLVSAMKNSKWPDGRPVYNLPVALSVMVFFALCAQCVSTLAIIKRETNSWFWPFVSFTYMTVLAYVGAFITYQVGMNFV
jgi:ferrous iron transport protein B